MPLPPSSDSVGARTIAPTGSSIDDVEDFLNTGDEEPIVEDKGTKDDKEIELVDKEDEEEEKIDLTKKEDEEEEEELETKDNTEEEIKIDEPPKKKQLLKDYPDIFKKHPFLEKMLYRDKQYQELFGSFDDAKEAHEKVQAYEHFESILAAGDTLQVLKTIKEEDPKVFDKVVDEYLITLYNVDKEAYFEVQGNIGKRFIAEMVAEAKKSDNDELRQAALILNQFLFNSSEYKPIQLRVQRTENDEQKKIEAERLALDREKFEGARDTLQTRADNILRNTISTYIDPRNVMSSFVKKQASREALEHLSKALGEDDSLKRNLDKLWRAAHAANYSKDSLAKIQSAYLGRAKNLLPTAIKKARAEALKDDTQRPRKEKEEEEVEERETPRRRTITPGRPSGQRSSNKGMEKGESVLDFLSRD